MPPAQQGEKGKDTELNECRDFTIVKEAFGLVQGNTGHMARDHTNTHTHTLTHTHIICLMNLKENLKLRKTNE